MRKELIIICTTIVICAMFFQSSYVFAGMADWTREDADKEAAEQMREQEEKTKNRENKSDNSYLSDLKVINYDISPKFDKDIHNYKIEQEIISDKIEIEATPEDSKAKVTGNGEINLNSGTNNIEIKVTAENGFTRIYNVIVTKSENENSPKLKDIKISAIGNSNSNSLELTPKFDSNIYSYEAEINFAIERVDIKCETESENSRVEVSGDYTLPKAENDFIIKITENSKETTYKIKIYNKHIAENAIIHKSDDTKKSASNPIIIIGILCGLLILIVLLTKKKKKRKTKH